MIKWFDDPTKAFIQELYDEAMMYKIGGYDWIKARNISSSSANSKRFTSRVPANAASNTFTMNAKFTGVSKWTIDKPHWSDTFYSNGYSLQFYINRTNSGVNSFGVYLHVFSQFIDPEDFCLPLNFVISLQGKDGQMEKIRPCKTTFRKSSSKGVANLGVNYEDYVINNAVTVAIEVMFEQLDK